jgi:protein tyrosine/serine phosphatase
VNDQIYRGGQPTTAAFSELAKLGVKTVVDLRQDHEHSKAAEARTVEALGMRYVSVPMNGFDTPEKAKVEKVVSILSSGEPVFVHCAQGRDRTGTVVAAYRIAQHRWTGSQALDEAKTCGMHWYMRGMMRFIASYQPTSTALAAEKPTTASVPGLVIAQPTVADSAAARP